MVALLLMVLDMNLWVLHWLLSAYDHSSLTKDSEKDLAKDLFLLRQINEEFLNSRYSDILDNVSFEYILLAFK